MVSSGEDNGLGDRTFWDSGNAVHFYLWCFQGVYMYNKPFCSTLKLSVSCDTRACTYTYTNAPSHSVTTTRFHVPVLR